MSNYTNFVFQPNEYIPLSLKLASYHPQNKFFWFHSDSPWRTITILYFPAILAMRIIFAACLNHQSQLRTASTQHGFDSFTLNFFIRFDWPSHTQVISVGVKQFNMKLAIEMAFDLMMFGVPIGKISPSVYFFIFEFQTSNFKFRNFKLRISKLFIFKWLEIKVWILFQANDFFFMRKFIFEFWWKKIVFKINCSISWFFGPILWF